MKNGLRLILGLLKMAVAAYLIGCVGRSWLQQLRQKLERVRPYAVEGVQE